MYWMNPSLEFGRSRMAERLRRAELARLVRASRRTEPNDGGVTYRVKDTADCAECATPVAA